MNVTTFLILLSAFSAITALVTEGVKKLAEDKVNLSYNIIALIIAITVGGAGTAVYYQLNSLPFNADNITYMILMGFASGLVSMTSYDKVKQAIEQLTNTREQ